MKTVKRIVKSQKVNMGGIVLDQPLPIADIEQMDPFLLIHHWDDTLPGNQAPNSVGVGPHPHRGFAPVSVIFEGNLHHRDSAGYNSLVEKGGTQWMNSGKGIIHSERPSSQMAKDGGHLEFIQFWINAPAEHKMDEPFYQALHADDTPVVYSEDKNVKISVIAGELNGKISPIKSYSKVNIYRIDVIKGGQITLNNPASYNALIYLLDGKLIINNKEVVGRRDMVLFNNDGDKIQIKGTEDTRALLLSGVPINEPLATYGPFVMNSQAELMSAIKDYQAGKMGHLNEEF